MKDSTAVAIIITLTMFALASYVWGDRVIAMALPAKQTNTQCIEAEIVKRCGGTSQCADAARQIIAVCE